MFKVDKVMFKGFTFKSLMQLEVLVASVLPVTAILIISTIGTKQTGPVGFYLFVAASFLGAAAVFFGELLLIQRIQHVLKQQIAGLMLVCQQYLAGDPKIRCALPSNDAELAGFARTLNMLMDQAAIQAKQSPASLQGPQSSNHSNNTKMDKAPASAVPPSSHPQGTGVSHPTHQAHTSHKQEVSPLERQLKQLIYELTPVLQGDLRVTAKGAPGDIGTLAGICNSLIAELIQFVQWVHYASEQVSDTVGNLLESAIELAQATETHMQRLSQTTETVEKIAVFIQHLNTTLHVSTENAHRALAYVQEIVPVSYDTGTTNTSAFATQTGELDAHRHMHRLLPRLQADIQRQVQLLEDLQTSTREHTTLAESTIEDLYTFAQRIHRSSADILTAAEQISGLAALARQWQAAVAPLRLPDEQLTVADPAQPPTGSTRPSGALLHSLVPAKKQTH